MQVDRFLLLGLPVSTALPPNKPNPRLQVSQTESQSVVRNYQLSLDKPVLALCPGAAFGSAKCWPAVHYAAVAEQKIQQGWQVWLFGSPKEQKAAAEIQRLTNNQCVDLSGKTSLSEAIDLLACVTAVVSNDSGLLHVAAALNRPVVAVYGSTTPKFSPPLTNNAKSLTLALSCSPCFKRECPLTHLNCLTQLQPQLVLQALNQLLPQQSPL